MTHYKPLLDELAQQYAAHAPISLNLNERAKKSMVDGGSHAVRLIQPFPPRVKAAHGASVTDEDGHTLIDFWQGHYANILGHNPEVVTTALAEAFTEGYGLQCGFAEKTQIEVAELLCRQTGMARVRLTTSGSLATMYAIMLARAFNGRELVMKIGGGWHGGHPWGLKGVKFEQTSGFEHTEGEGFPPVFGEQVVQTQFNNCQMLSEHFQRYGDRLACFILEPVIGGGGFIPATREYLQTARSLATRYGVVLIFDEIIAGFRFRAGDVGQVYGIQADLLTLGKIIGGGMPVAAVAGRQDILENASGKSGPRVWFSGGTYSGHPASMLAAKTMINHLVEHEAEIYPRLAALGQLARQSFVDAFKAEGIPAVSTGANADLADSSLFILHFPHHAEQPITSPEDANDPALCNVELSKKVLPLGLLLQDIHMLEGKGAVSFAHTRADIQGVAEACQALARRVKQLEK